MLKAHPRSSNYGFTLIELLCVIVIIGALSASAIPQVLDFRNDAKVSLLRMRLNTLRIGLKNQVQQSIMKCGIINNQANYYNGAVRMGIYEAIWSPMRQNDVTDNNGGALDSHGLPQQLCTTAQVPAASDRKFWSDPSGSEMAYGKNSFFGGWSATGYKFPANPLVFDDPGLTDISLLVLPHDVQIQAQGGRCGYVNFLRTSGQGQHWVFNLDTGDLFAGTNTSGVQECNF